MNKKTSIEQKIVDSKIDIIKKSLYFIIAPVVILILGIILISTVGFSKGIDFTGGQTFKVYVNNEAKLEDVASYDLSKSEDYNKVYDKITMILEKNNVNLISYQTSKVDLKEYNVYGGQAVQVTYQTNASSKDGSIIRAELIDAFDYSNFDGAISSIDETMPVSSFNWFIGLLAGVVFALIAAIIYMAIRFSKSAIFVVFIQAALDIFLTLSLLLICRVTVNLTVGIVVLSAFMLSLINSFVYYNKVRDSRTSGLVEGKTNYDIANQTIKQTTYKKALFYICTIVVSLIFIILSVSAVRDVALGIMLSLVATFYTSTFILPSFWALVDKPKKKKKKI